MTGQSTITPVAVEAPASARLGETARAFFAYLSPRVLVPVVAAAWAGRIVLGGWRWWDLAVPGIILGLQPFTEWTIHVYLLHFRPSTWRGRRIDPLVARKHREHHRDPRDPRLVFIPGPVILQSVVIGSLVLGLAIPSHRLALTAIGTSYGMMLVYEWTHYLIHSPYRPRSRLYRYVWRAHRLHHYRNENYWFGVTVHVADHLLRTFPEKDAVPPSPTARTLGVEAA